MWAAGAVLGEMLAGRPLFPGRSDIDQLHKILQVGLIDGFKLSLSIYISYDGGWLHTPPYRCGGFQTLQVRRKYSLEV